MRWTGATAYLARKGERKPEAITVRSTDVEGVLGPGTIGRLSKTDVSLNFEDRYLERDA